MSPVGTLYYAWYDALDDVREELEGAAVSLQCIATQVPDMLKVTTVPTVSLTVPNPKPWITRMEWIR